MIPICCKIASKRTLCLQYQFTRCESDMCGDVLASFSQLTMSFFCKRRDLSHIVIWLPLMLRHFQDATYHFFIDWQEFLQSSKKCTPQMQVLMCVQSLVQLREVPHLDIHIIKAWFSPSLQIDIAPEILTHLCSSIFRYYLCIFVSPIVHCTTHLNTLYSCQSRAKTLPLTVLADQCLCSRAKAEYRCIGASSKEPNDSEHPASLWRV